MPAALQLDLPEFLGSPLFLCEPVTAPRAPWNVSVTVIVISPGDCGMNDRSDHKIDRNATIGRLECT
jgi:hypothetical protein